MLNTPHKTHYRKKITVTFFICAGLLAILFFRLVYLMVAKADYYSAKAQELHERERSIKAARGRILDCNGTVIADNRTVCTISVIYNQIEDREAVISMLCRELSLPEEYVRKRVEKYSSIERIKSNVDKETGDRIREYDLAGVKVDEDYKRFYPYGELGSKVLGFTDNVISHGHSPSSRILVQNVEPADENLANIFSVNPGDQIFHMRSLAFIDNELYAMIDDYVDNSSHPRLLNMDFTKAAILNELAADGCVIATMRGLLEIRPANSYEAMNLNLKIGSPITVFQNTAYDQAQNAVIHSVVRSLAYETSYEIYTDCQI